MNAKEIKEEEKGDDEKEDEEECLGNVDCEGTKLLLLSLIDKSFFFKIYKNLLSFHVLVCY